MILRLVSWGVRHPRAFNITGAALVIGLVAALTYTSDSLWHNFGVLALAVAALGFGMVTITLVVLENSIRDSEDHPYVARLILSSWIKREATKRRKKPE